jgi:hypothetical protein
MVRADPGDPFDGVGWSRLAMTAGNKVDNEYVMWRKDVFADTRSLVDSGCGDNVNQQLHPRVGDALWPYYGGYR